MRLAAAVSLLAACAVELPPPQMPEPIVPRPNVVLGPPAAGEGDVLIDTVGGAADVVDVQGFGSASTSRTVCSTPCEVHLSQGLHDLKFLDQVDYEWRGDGRITVGAVPSAYRYALGRQDVSYGALLTAVTLTVVGGALLVPSAIDFQPGLFGAAVGLTVLGAVGMYIFRGKVQPGAGVQWTPQPAAGVAR